MSKKNKLAKTDLFEVEDAKLLTPLEVVDIPPKARKLTPSAIIESLERVTGESYADRLAANYREAVLNEDAETILAYDRLFIGKLVQEERAEMKVQAGGVTITFSPGKVEGFDE